jgi:hypothetical protein
MGSALCEDPAATAGCAARSRGSSAPALMPDVDMVIAHTTAPATKIFIAGKP